MADVRQRKKKAVTATAQGGSDKKQSQKKAAKQAGGGGVGAAKLVSIALALVLLGALAFVVLSPTTTTPPPSTTPSTAPPKPQQQQQQQQQPAGAHEEPAATPEPASETQKGSDGGEEDALSFVQRMKVATSKKVAEELQQPDDNQEEQDVKEQGKQPASSPHDPAVPFAAHPQIEFDIEGPNDHAVPGALSKVISPLSLVNLFYTYTDEHPFHIKRVDDYYAGLNSNLSHIDLLLQIHAATAHDEELLSPETNKTQANCAFVKHGMGSLNDKYPDAYHAYLDGCTIVCNIVPAYWQPLAGLMHGVQQETGLAYMANMYLTPRASQGFVEHTDNKDGLIVQTDGRKEWVLKNTKFPMPLRHQMVGRPWERPASTVAADTAAEPLLTAGDVLFIPRGMPHYAKSAGDYPSLHFTVSPTKNLEWVDFYRDIADVSKPFVAARVETLLGDDAPSVQEMLQCMGALADATTAAVAAAAEEPLHYELRRSLPWWYRALAGVTVPSVHSAIGYTVKQCKDRLAQQEADAERVAAVSALVDKLAKGVTMPKVFDLLNLCRPRTPAVPIASVSQCDAVSGKLRAKGIAFLDDLLGDVMEDHELLKTVLPNALKRNSVFVDYTAKLHAKGLEIDPASFSAVALHPTTSVAFTATPWSFQVNKSSITITAGAEAASQPQRVEFRHTPQLEQLLKRVQGLQDGDGASFQLHELATAVSPRDDFEVACLVRVLARLNVLEPAAANKQHAADGDHGEASVPEQYEHLITDTPAPPPVTDTQQQQQQEEKKKEEEEEEEGDEVEIVTDDDGRADENSEPKKD